MRKTPLFNRLRYSKKHKVLGVFERREIFSSQRWAGNSTGAVDRAQSFPGEAGPDGRGTKTAQELQGKGTQALSLVLALNSKFIAGEFQDSILSVGHTETWNCSNALLSLTQLFGCLLTVSQQLSKRQL